MKFIGTSNSYTSSDIDELPLVEIAHENEKRDLQRYSINPKFFDELKAKNLAEFMKRKQYIARPASPSSLCTRLTVRAALAPGEKPQQGYEENVPTEADSRLKEQPSSIQRPASKFLNKELLKNLDGGHLDSKSYMEASSVNSILGNSNHLDDSMDDFFYRSFLKVDNNNQSLLFAPDRESGKKV